ncbi:manganese catalase family protein [Bacillus sp. Marseille-P3661]|uniref:manganese catalase family protein n=1 Tax=Bacillus sp. Marseille-P3661 TaxID=1936234 RepID=UPI0015E17D1A|nr:manganese catalase family protein [Bacillus sp. Marseille-P3661]
MFIHQKELLFPVNVKSPNPTYAAAVLEQFGGANGELKACLQYFAQSFSAADPAIRDLLLDIATEEISHLEMVGTCITQLMGGPDKDPSTYGGQDVEMATEGLIMSNAKQMINDQINSNSTVQKSVYLTGHGLDYVDSSGSPFTGNFINNVGDMLANLQSDLAAELRARKVYEELHRHVQDPGAREMFDFLIQREEAHAMFFEEAIERIKATQPERSFGDKQFSRLYPDLSQGGTGKETFSLMNSGLITGPFTGDPDQDTFGGENPPLSH